jgi:hypothetical protein
MQQRTLICSGQTSDENGTPVHEGDMGSQVERP